MTVRHVSHPATKHRGNEFRPFFWVDSNLRVSYWPEVTAKAMRVSPRHAVGRWCWEVVHGIRSNLPPPPCYAFCPVSGHDRRDTWSPPGFRASGSFRCAAISQPDAASGAVVWFPLTRALAERPAVPWEELIIRGCLSARLDNLSETVDSIRRLCGADDTEVFLIDPVHGEVNLVDCEGPDRDVFLERTRIPLGAGYPGTVAAKQKPLWTTNFQNDRLFLRQGVKKCGITSFIGFPLSDGRKPLGYLGVAWRDARISLDWILRTLDTVCPLLLLALPPSRVALPVPEPAGTNAPLAIRCFGTFEVFRHGSRLPTRLFLRRKAITLLKILLLHAGRPVHRDMLVEQLWPGCDHDHGVNSLHSTVHALRSAIESYRDGRKAVYICGQDDSYFFGLDSPHDVDLFRFDELVKKIREARHRGESRERLVALIEEAVSLYRGDLFADDPYTEHFESRRRHQRQRYLELVQELARERIAAGCAADAVNPLRAALELDPGREEIHRALIEALLHANCKSQAREQYEACMHVLREDLGLEPHPQTLALRELLY